ncbi:GntR family transcriptional regulator [Enhydrobacter sp.]|jgi:DNA-binding GntR family transcriptional regulator|uniref:GntR family transcriptional regulator n=1 Tax=Enhydrobacter sp. TaxID=1894999 RepID=UPI002615AE1F|nr:GntR family transcriptional regulator [Enhydrobacter sp.]
MRPFDPEPDLSERIHDAVLEAICSGELKSGARITQEELANRFGVSRQPVLQAMMLLRREGFLVDAGRKGVCVAPLDVEQANNLYIVRAALDAVAARLAAARYTRELAHRGRLLLDVGRRAIASGYIPSAIEADIDFHLFIYEASGNPVISETTQPHWQHLRRVMAAVLSEEDLRVSVWDEHEAILQTLEAGDASRAEALCRKHAEQTAGVLTSRLKAVISRAA